MAELSDLAAAARAAGHPLPPDRLEAALPLWRAMLEAARRLERLRLDEPPA